MAVVATSEMGKTRKSKWTLGRFCLSWEDLRGAGFLGGFFVVLVWIFCVLVAGWFGGFFGRGDWFVFGFCFVFVIVIYLV